jgi:hypothetical protein
VSRTSSGGYRKARHEREGGKGPHGKGPGLMGKGFDPFGGIAES